jgi:hypothetical protein
VFTIDEGKGTGRRFFAAPSPSARRTPGQCRGDRPVGIL